MPHQLWFIYLKLFTTPMIYLVRSRNPIPPLIPLPCQSRMFWPGLASSPTSLMTESSFRPSRWYEVTIIPRLASIKPLFLMTFVYLIFAKPHYGLFSGYSRASWTPFSLNISFQRTRRSTDSSMARSSSLGISAMSVPFMTMW